MKNKQTGRSETRVNYANALMLYLTYMGRLANLAKAEVSTVLW